MTINAKNAISISLRTLFLVLALFIALGVGYIRADVIIKAPGGTDLTASASWDAVVPGLADVAAWDSNSLCTNLTLYNYESWAGISVGNVATNIDISGWATLTLGSGGIDLSASTVNVSIAAPILLASNQTWIVAAGTSLTMASGISGSSNLTVSGAGTLELTANNPNFGLINVNGGTLLISGQLHSTEGYAHLNALAVNTNGLVRVASGNANGFLGECNFDAQFNTLSGGTLEFDTTNGASENVDRAFAIGPGNGTIEVLNTNATLTFDYFGDEFQFSVPMGTSLVLSGAGTGVMNKVISGGGGVIKAGPGTWTMGGANSYGGDTVISNGTLNVTGSIGANVVVASGGTLSGTGVIAGNLTFLPGGTPRFSSSTTFVIEGSLILNGNTVHVLLPDNLAAGIYTLATYSTSGNSGTVSTTPVIDSGSITPGNIATITANGGQLKLVVNQPMPHLTVVSVNNGTNASAEVGFNVVVQSLDANNHPLILPTDTNVVLGLDAGSGILGGNITGVIAAGTDSVTITNVTYSISEVGVVIEVLNTNGTLLAGSSDAFTVVPGPAAIISITAGNNWTDIPGMQLANPFVVTVTDINGDRVPGASVTFAIASTPPGATGQSLTIVNAVTDALGEASTTLKLGSAAGTYSVTAASGNLAGSPVTFVAHASDNRWREVWSDEFDYNGLPDTTKWAYESGYVRNGEAQYYTVGRTQNVFVTNGMLTVTARQETYTPPGQTGTVPYTSASLVTLNKQSWLYGKFEARCLLPAGLGSWPAFWAMGSDNPQVGWPTCGEIDMMEYIGMTPGVIHENAFWERPVGGTTAVSASQGSVSIPDCATNFHIYSMEWNPRTMSFFVDGTNYYTWNLADAGPYYLNPFYKPFYILVDNAIGGDYNGYQLDGSILPTKFIVDYVRVYQQLPTWTGGGDDAGWSNTNNWDINEPVTGDLVVFSGTTNLAPEMDSSNNLAGINFDCAAGSFVLGTPNGSILTLTASGINNSSSNLQTVNVPVTLAANQAFSTTTAGLTINGPISGNGFGLTKAGPGALTLDGTNSYTGGTLITAGILALGSHGLLAPNSGISIFAGATFDVSAPGSFTMNANAPLTASGMGTAVGVAAATINAGTGGVINLNSNLITLAFDGQDPALYIPQGTLCLGGNAIVINTTNGLPLAAGTYRLIQQAAGTITSMGTFPSVTGTAIGVGQAASISVTGNTVNLVMSSSASVKINPPVVQSNGGISFTFSGGASGVSYRFQANDGLNSSNWITLATLVAGTNGLSGYTDSTISNHTARYYRTVTP